MQEGTSLSSHNNDAFVVAEPTPQLPENETIYSAQPEIAFIPGLEKFRPTRRQAILGTAGLLALLFVGCSPRNASKHNSEVNEPTEPEHLAEYVGGEFIDEHLETFAFNEEATRRFMVENKIPESEYGKLAAAGVTFITLYEKEGETRGSKGSGGIVRFRDGNLYFMTTTHVIEHWALEQPASQLLIHVPGFPHMITYRPNQVYTFTPGFNDKYDVPVLIKLEENVLSLTQKLISQEKLSPLYPMPYDRKTHPNVNLFRFQGGEVGLHSLQFAFGYPTSQANTDFYALDVDDNLPVMCPGVSGSLALVRTDTGFSEQTAGLLTHSRVIPGDYGTSGSTTDQHHTLGAECNARVSLTSFGLYQHAFGLTPRTLNR